jgi:hypothetical protein
MLDNVFYRCTVCADVITFFKWGIHHEGRAAEFRDTIFGLSIVHIYSLILCPGYAVSAFRLAGNKSGHSGF